MWLHAFTKIGVASCQMKHEREGRPCSAFVVKPAGHTAWTGLLLTQMYALQITTEESVIKRLMRQWRDSPTPYAANDSLAVRNCDRMSSWLFQQRVQLLKRFSRLSSLTPTEKSLEPQTSMPSLPAGWS